MTAKCPAWLTWTGTKGKPKKSDDFQTNDGAETVRYIFRRTADGIGQRELLAELTAEHKPLGPSGRWNSSYIAKILSDRSVLGEFHPRKQGEKTEGGPIRGYYPAVVKEPLWNRAQAAKKAKLRMRGPSKLFCNLFTGIVTNAHDGTTCHIQTTRQKGSAKIQRRLISYAHSDKQPGFDPITIPLDEFEACVLRHLVELRADELDRKDTSSTIRMATQELAGIDKRRGELVAALESPTGGSVAALQFALSNIDKRRDELAEQVRSVEAMSATAEPLSQAKSVVELLKTADPENLHQLRQRLRSYIADLVESFYVAPEKHFGRIWCLIQVNYRNGKFRCIGFGPGWIHTKSGTSAMLGDQWAGFDLRDKRQANKPRLAKLAELITSPAVVKTCSKTKPTTAGPAAAMWLQVKRGEMRPASFRVVGPKVGKFVTFVGADLPTAQIDRRLWSLFTRHLRAELRDGCIAHNSAIVALNRAREFCQWVGADVGNLSARKTLEGNGMGNRV